MNISSSAAYLFQKKLENFYFDIYLIVGCARGQYEANPVFWLASRAGKMDPSCPLGIGRVDRAKEKNCWLGWIGTIFKFHHLSSCKMMWAMMVFIIFIIPYKSLWSSDEIYFYRNWTNWLLIAICNGNLWISWTCWIVYTIVTIFPALSKILCFNMLQTSSKVTSTWKK